jgi:hypothetical protein
MRTLCIVLLSIALIALSPILTCAQDQPAAPPPQDQADNQQLSEADIDTLVAPIALYPDPLISQILPAATYPDDVQAAANWLAQNPNNPDGIDAQSWDLSVKAVAHYPQVLQKMSSDMDWTLALGQAYAAQQEEVLQSVQRLRETARGAGTLQSTPQQRVIVEGSVIRIVPANPRIVYVPSYDPEVVYVAGPPYRRGLIGFTAGFMIGSWLNSDCDWHRHRVYYHGWVGPGWIAYSRPYVRVNRIYVNDGFHRRVWMNPNPRFHGRPMVRNRVYVDRHFNRYEFNRNRGTRDMRRPPSAIDRINAARDRGGRGPSTTRTDFGGRGPGGRTTSTTTVIGGRGPGGRTTSTTTTVTGGRGPGGRTTSTTTVIGGRGPGGRTTSTTTVTGGRGPGGRTTSTTTVTGGRGPGGRTTGSTFGPGSRVDPPRNIGRTGGGGMSTGGRTGGGGGMTTGGRTGGGGGMATGGRTGGGGGATAGGRTGGGGGGATAGGRTGGRTGGTATGDSERKKR